MCLYTQCSKISVNKLLNKSKMHCIKCKEIQMYFDGSGGVTTCPCIYMLLLNTPAERVTTCPCIYMLLLNTPAAPRLKKVLILFVDILTENFPAGSCCSARHVA